MLYDGKSKALRKRHRYDTTNGFTGNAAILSVGFPKGAVESLHARSWLTPYRKEEEEIDSLQNRRTNKDRKMFIPLVLNEVSDVPCVR